MFTTGVPLADVSTVGRCAPLGAPTTCAWAAMGAPTRAMKRASARAGAERRAKSRRVVIMQSLSVLVDELEARRRSHRVQGATALVRPTGERVETEPIEAAAQADEL